MICESVNPVFFFKILGEFSNPAKMSPVFSRLRRSQAEASSVLQSLTEVAARRHAAAERLQERLLAVADSTDTRDNGPHLVNVKWMCQEFQRGAIHGGSREAHYPLTGWD